MTKWIVTAEITHLAMGDYDTMCEIKCTCGESYNLQYDSKCPKCEKDWFKESVESQKGMLENQEWESLEKSCGSVVDHVKQNTCPKKNGKVGDDHYELYVQWDYIVEADSEQEANDQATSIELELKENKELDDYLKSIGVTDFDSDDFDGDIINCEELSISTRVNHNDTARTYLDRYSRDPKMKLSTQLAENKPLPIRSEMIIVHEKLYYDNGV